MDVVDFWRKQVTKWNEDEQCGKCWTFSAPMRESDINEFQQRDKDAECDNCCVHVFLANLTSSTQRTYSQSTGLLNGKDCSWSFDVNVVQKDKLGVNVYDEIKGYGIEDSKWETILKPIMDCMDCDLILDFCALQGYQVDITRWNSFQRIDWLDDNYTGWTYQVTFRLKDQ